MWHRQRDGGTGSRATAQERLPLRPSLREGSPKVKAITEELCGHSFSASAISAINQRLDASMMVKAHCD
jgi:hypothetical protein